MNRSGSWLMPGGRARKERHMGNKGKAGCGCLIGILITIMILAGVLIHPVSLKFMAKQFIYEDRIVPADAIFVPRFLEDRKGELYIEAFREYFAGNGRVIYIENDRILGTSIVDFVSRMAKERGIKESAIKPIEPGENEDKKAGILKEKIKASGIKKMVVVVPEYASRRYHHIYDPSGEGGTVLYMIKSVRVSYFQGDRWWRDAFSRSVVARELYSSILYYYSRLLKKDNTK